jgi:hypothetical protein
LRGAYVGGSPQWNNGGLSDHLPLAIDIEEPVAGERTWAKRRKQKIKYTTDLKPRFEKLNSSREIVTTERQRGGAKLLKKNSPHF